VRAVLDVNVLISALLAPAGAPARLIVRWLAGDFELIASERLLAELARALAYPKLRTRVSHGEALALIELLRAMATINLDARNPARISRDPADDYLLSLAATTSSVLVSGDRDLLEMAADLPINSPSSFLVKLVDESTTQR
jgi:putative PIN family toxin of toxin-antitoxin system